MHTCKLCAQLIARVVSRIGEGEPSCPKNLSTCLVSALFMGIAS
jgi:hypothetical protein